jgi:hypothetical protein
MTPPYLIVLHGPTAVGKVLFVALTSSIEVQDARIGDDSRAAFGKLRSVDIQRELRRKGLMDYPPLPESGLTIDTGKMGPEEAAQEITRYFDLSIPDRDLMSN